MESEYETVRLGGEDESGPSPWHGGAVPLRGAATPDPERERRLEIVSRGARRRRAIRRGFAAAALLVPLALGVFLLPSGEPETKAPGELHALAQRAPARPGPPRPAPDARQRRGGQHPHGRDVEQKRAEADRVAVAVAAPSRTAAETPTTVETEPAPTEPTPVEPAPPPPAAGPSDGEAAEAEFGFEN